MYEKIHVTPDEQKFWGLSQGSQVKTFDTDCGRIGILICYDVEFPELSRLMADQGMQILFVPFNTDTQNAYNRVRICAQARAIENECYVAIAGSVILRVLCGSNSRPETLRTSVLVAFLVACLVSMLFGAFNGVLVAYFKIQPMVATLILYTAGRSIAAWINNNELPLISDPSFGYYGGFLPGIPIPTPFFIAAACVIIIALVLKFTNLGLYTQAVGINEKSSRLNGINPTFIKFLSFVILGLCVAVVGLIKVSRLSTINYSVIAKDIEMDAILAVALGGNSLSGGKFNMAASILGAYVIQFLTTTLYKFDVQSDALPAYKAVVVILLVVLSAPAVREKLAGLGKKFRAKEVA